MGGWTLEVARMALYMTFPVALFHIFNQPEYFEEWVTKTKREIYPPEDEEMKKQLQDAIRAIRQKREEHLMREIENMDKLRNP